VEANVPTIANLLSQLNHVLSLLQHLRDKFQIFAEYQNGSDWKAMIEQEQEHQIQAGVDSIIIDTMTSNLLRFAGRVVVVTGAGNGLGKEYALAFAERGASVVINDLGGTTSGEGKNSRAADDVVALIISKGGIAVPDYNSVENGKAIIDTAINAFGRIDILINNAGILRDKSFLNMQENDWDLVHRIHLRSSYLVSQAAWAHMRKQQYGKIVMTSSTSGIYGNFGQANYSAAKLGLVGLSNTLAIEGSKYGISCNAIAPTAYSRLTQSLLPDDAEHGLKPEFVMPLVLYLSHETCDETGSLFEVAGGWIGKVRWEKSSGAVVRKKNCPMTPEDVRDNWDKITNFSNPMYHKTQVDQVTHLMDVIKQIDSGSDDKSSLMTKSDEFTQTFTYTQNNTILYALSIGCSTRQPNALQYLYENHENFSVLPTFAVIPAQALTMNIIGSSNLGFEVDLAKVLHGEQYVELFRPLPPTATLTLKGKIVDVLDKGSGAVIIYEVEMYDEAKELLGINQFVIFSVGSGGFGGHRDTDKQIKSAQIPKRKPDKVSSEKTNIDQAALYRLNGDSNPLHIDSEFAAIAGFQQPILHGLCTFGYAARHILHEFANDDTKLFKAIKVRFTKPVIPGQSIETHMWQEGNRIYFESRVPESNQTVLSGGYVDLHSVIINNDPPGSITNKQSETPERSEESKTGADLKAKAAFDEINKRVTAQPDLVKKINAIIVFDITKDGAVVQSWTIDGKKGKLYSGKPDEAAQATITVDDEDFVNLAAGKASAPVLFTKGKLKLKGNVMLAQKLSTLFKEQSKL
ncbi:unnamed protein product, partial [Didymodactylos carnosus]